MKNVWFLCLVFYVTTASAQSYRGFRHIITGDEIEYAGLLRPSDFLQLIPEWNSYTIDSYRWIANANSLDADGEQSWAMLVNGQQYDIGIFNTVNLNMLPVFPFRIDTLEVSNTPVLINGRLYKSGVLNIRTKPIKKGFSLGLLYASGNETGDPGPYYFTEYATGNVEELGPDLGIGLAYSNEDISGRLDVYAKSFQATDVRTRQRNMHLHFKFFKGWIFSPSLTLQTKAFEGEHTLSAFYSTTDSPHFLPYPQYSTDLSYFRVLGYDIPHHTSHWFVGAKGSVPIMHKEFYYAAELSGKKLWKPEDIKMTYLKMDQLSISTTTGIKGSLGNVLYDTGIAFEQKITKDFYEHSLRLDTYSFFGELQTDYPNNLHHAIGFVASKKANELYVNVLLENRWEFENHLYFLKTSYIEKHPVEDFSRIYYESKNLNFFNETLRSINVLRDPTKVRMLTLDASYQYSGVKDLYFRLGGGVRSFSDKMIETYSYSLDSISRVVTDNALIHKRNGVSYYADASAEHRINKEIQQKIYYRYTPVFTSDDVLNNKFRTIPVHKFFYSIHWKPDENLSFYSKFTFNSATHWSEYNILTNLSNGEYPAKRNSIVLLDLSMQKWFWNRQIKTNIFFRNLFNWNQRYHPLSADSDLSFNFSVEFHFH